MPKKLKISRVQADLTQKELAQEVGVSRQTIGLIERGEYNPSLKLCLNICYAANKTLDDIFWIDKKDNDKYLAIKGIHFIYIC